MAFISARINSFLGLENFDTIITIACSEMPFDVSSCCVETSRLVCTVGHLAGFCMTGFQMHQ